MTNLARKVINALYRVHVSGRANRILGSKELGAVALRESLPIWRVGKRKDGTRFLMLGSQEIDIPRDALGEAIITAHRELASMVERQGVTVELDSADSKVTIRWREVCFQCANLEEIYISHEILVRDDYSVVLSRPFIFIDVGSNIGFTSVYIANLNANCKVFSYEPLEVNVRRQHQTLDVNEAVKSKITVKPYGLGANGRKDLIYTRADARGCSSTIRPNMAFGKGPVEQIKIEIRDVVTELSEIASVYPFEPMAMKIDCEGGEYEIIEALCSSGVVAGIDLLIIEWHRIKEDLGPEVLIKRLNEAGFFVIIRGELQRAAGMLYCARTPGPVQPGSTSES